MNNHPYDDTDRINTLARRIDKLEAVVTKLQDDLAEAYRRIHNTEQKFDSTKT